MDKPDFRKNGTIAQAMVMLVLMFGLVGTVSASCADDYPGDPVGQALCVVYKIWDRLGNVWDAVEEAGTETWQQVEDTWNAVKTETGRTVIQVAEATETTVNDIQDTMEMLTEGADRMTNQIQIRIDGAWEELNYRVDNEQDEVEAFIGNSADGCTQICQDFRDDLFEMVLRTEHLFTTLITFQGTGVQYHASAEITPFPTIDFSGLNYYLSNAPGISLYPLWRAMTVLEGASPSGAEFLPALNTDLARATSAVRILQDIIKAPPVYEPEPLPLAASLARVQKVAPGFVGNGVCDSLTDDPTQRAVIEDALPVLQVVGLLLKTVGGLLHAGGNSTVETSIWFSVPIMEVKDNKMHQFGDLGIYGGSVLLDAASIVGGNILSCDVADVLRRLKDKEKS